MGWTEKQQLAIDTRDSSILVSASAGSGKTAVLVERILSQVMDKSAPCNIDDFLVVTFTKAAAAQMREKISARLEKALEEEPENEHLIKQLVLVNHADITTIDSFCLRLVKEHFSLLDLDSVFQIGDNGMMTLLQMDVLKEMFDEQYAIPDNKAFYRLLDYFDGGQAEDDLQANILRIYDMAASYPRPRVWIERAKEALSISTKDELEKTDWMKELVAVAHAQAGDARLLAHRALEVCSLAGGPDKYIPMATSDLDAIEAICEAQDFEALHNTTDVKWMRLATCKPPEYDEDLIAEFKNIRDQYKELIKKLNIFKHTAEGVVEQIQSMKEYLVPLLDLVLLFMDKFEAAKDKRRIMTFADVEHLAYQLVCAGYDADGKQIPTEVGKQVSKRYREIYIDEYQDSNYLQEDILCAISGMHRGVYNLFMVGDVKQSIYRFRMARPDLFLSKYKNFKQRGDEVKIELLENFRSRAVVLDAANYFFYQLMGADLGGIAYDKSVALVPKLEFEDATGYNISTSTEVLIVDRDSAVEVADSENEDTEIPVDASHMDGLQLEAHMVAQKINEIVNGDNPMMVYDSDAKCYRKAMYRDIVILGRSMKRFGETMRNALSLKGIPVYLEDPKGYFNAVEIRIILSLLAVIDNTRQDIPLSAVLLSPIARMTEDELARICAPSEVGDKRRALLYDRCVRYMEAHDDAISQKLHRFFEIIDELKEEKKQISISKLIWEALKRTGYYDYASAMPMGEKRKANIDMLLEKANAFENGYYKGLFHFLRYIEKLKLQDTDFGEANILSDDADVVRIMSMHKSKGLEYPIVFVSGLGREFNKQDTQQLLVLHSDYYLSSMVFSEQGRYKKSTFTKEAFCMLMDNESMAEELRVLYVAMTRAKEKLYLTGAVSSFAKACEKWYYPVADDSYLLPFGVRKGAKNFIQYIVACMLRYDELAKPLHVEGLLNMQVYSVSQIAAGIQGEVIQNQIAKEELHTMAVQASKDSYYEQFKTAFEATYPYEKYTKLQGKMSISDIKKMKAYDGQGYDADTEFTESKEQQSQYVDVSTESDESTESGTTAKTQSSITGAMYGTIMHKLMELIPFEQLETLGEDAYIDFVKTLKTTLVADGIFAEEEAAVLSVRKVVTMLKSTLGKRMIKAASKDLLFKEQQFSAGIKPTDVYSDLPATEDLIIVQGIVDAFFYEDGEIVLMDYKTDHADADTIRGRYQAQMDYYAQILEQLTGCKVKEKVFYSFYLGSCVTC